jgi:hypothetical protein
VLAKCAFTPHGRRQGWSRARGAAVEEIRVRRDRN